MTLFGRKPGGPSEKNNTFSGVFSFFLGFLALQAAASQELATFGPLQKNHT
jgi:hypothetical protein